VADAKAQPLPKGRHGLTRAQVEASQRSRMLLAIADAMAEKGYVGTSVADVLSRARVSRETFYQHFSSKLDCFLDAFDVAGQFLLGRMAQANPEAAGTLVGRFERAFGAYVDCLAEQPAVARVFLVEVYAAGPEAMARRVALQAQIVDWLADLLDARSKQDRFACQALVAAVSSLVTDPIVQGDEVALRQLRHDVVHLVRRALADRAAH
jgi:AcrR family transcriptional regulator